MRKQIEFESFSLLFFFFVFQRELLPIQMEKEERVLLRVLIDGEIGENENFFLLCLALN